MPHTLATGQKATIWVAVKQCEGPYSPTVWVAGTNMAVMLQVSEGHGHNRKQSMFTKMTAVSVLF